MKDRRMEFRCTEEERTMFNKCAKMSGECTAVWIRLTLREAVKSELGSDVFRTNTLLSPPDATWVETRLRDLPSPGPHGCIYCLKEIDGKYAIMSRVVSGGVEVAHLGCWRMNNKDTT